MRLFNEWRDPMFRSCRRVFARATIAVGVSTALVGGALLLTSSSAASEANYGGDVLYVEKVTGRCIELLTHRLKKAALAENFQISADPKAVVAAIRPDAMMIQGLDRNLPFVDPIQFEQGIRSGIVYLEADPSIGLAAGFYVATMYAPSGVTLGRIDIEVVFSTQGQDVAKASGYADITSLTVPPGVPPSIEAGLGLGSPDQTGTAAPEKKKYYYVKCSNGGYTCYDANRLVPPGMSFP